jgi:hypothetical protein
MNDDTGGRRGCRRPGALAAALAGIALLAAACGGGGSPVAAGSTAYQKSVAYAQCMRAHGEPGYPDPPAMAASSSTGRQTTSMVP